MPPLFRADQVGSLIRPSTLVGTAQYEETYSESSPSETLSTIQDAMSYAVQKQLDLSIRPLSGGEYDRHIFCSGFHEHLEGMASHAALRVPEDFRVNIPNITGFAKLGYKTYGGVVASGKICHGSSKPLLKSWDLLKGVVPEDKWKECKVSIPSITWQHEHLAHGTAFTKEAYGSDKEYFADLAAAYRRELQLLYDSGLRSVQVDDPALTFFVVEEFREGLRADGIDPDELLDLYIWAHNETLRELPKDMHVGVHLCRGNMPKNIPGHEHFNATGSYEHIAHRLFRQLKYNTLYLEFDDARSGDFAPLRFLPKGTNVVLGLVSTKSPELEDLDTLEARVREAAGVIAEGQGVTVEDVLRDAVGVSPQCGFASFKEARGVDTEERMWEKLVLVRDLARRIWPDAQ